MALAVFGALKVSARGDDLFIEKIEPHAVETIRLARPLPISGSDRVAAARIICSKTTLPKGSFHPQPMLKILSSSKTPVPHPRKDLVDILRKRRSDA